MPDKTSSSKSITVSIVSHGQQELALQLLLQLEKHCLHEIDKVILTVNVPETDLVSNKRWTFAIEVVMNVEPHGFGANHNRAFKRCTSPWFLVLNPDIRLDTDVLGMLLAQAKPQDGVLSPRIEEPGSGHAGVEPHRALLTPYEILCRNQPTYRRPQSPAWIAGMFMLFSAQAFEEVQGFDQRFFMYGEDFDICARLRLAGWHILIGESSKVQHEARRASRKDQRHLLWHMASLLRVWLSPTFWRYRALLREIEPRR